MLTPRLDRLDKNFIINGGLDYWQYGPTTTNLDNVPKYTSSRADRFLASCTPTLTYFSSRSTNVPLNGKSRYSINFEGSPVADTDTIVYQHRIEGHMLRQFLEGRFSFGFWARSQSADNINISFNTANALDDFSGVTEFKNVNKSISPDGAWYEIKEENFDIPAAALNGVEIIITLSGMTVTGSSVNHGLTQFKLNSGKTLQEFSLAGRELATEFMLCQRYFERSYGLDLLLQTDTPQGCAFGIAANTTEVVWNKNWAVEKRAIPTVTLYSKAGTVGAITFTDSFAELATANASHIGTSGCRYVVRAGGVTKGNGYLWHWTSSAELT